MALKIVTALDAAILAKKINQLLDLSAAKILSLERSWGPGKGAPVFTVKGRYASRGWTEWTEGFRFGSALLQFEATGERRFLKICCKGTHERIPAHVSLIGVHKHGFNVVSTYGNLRRLIC